MSHSIQGFCVAVEHVEAGDWALVLTASRTGDERYFTPFLFACDTAGLFATCPNADIWARQGLLRIFKTQGLTPEIREELLRNSITDIFRQIGAVCSILERVRVGIVPKMKATGYDQALPGFKLDTEQAFRWLYEHKRGENAVSAMRICRYLADKHGIGRLSLSELNNLAERKIRKGF